MTKQATMIQKSSGKYSGEIIIPEAVEYLGATYSVTSILNAFNNCYGLTSVSIPNSVKTIGLQAFLYCSGLTSVTIPNSVTSIGDYAFWGCSALTSVTIGNSVESIGTQAFYICSALTSVTIPKSVTRIRDRAFGSCSGLTSIVVDSGNSVFDSRNNSNAIIETATNTLLYGCSTTIIPDDVTSIGDDAFSGCSGLTSVTIPNSVTSIGDYAFCGCSALTSMTIGNSVESMGSGAFEGCYFAKENFVNNSSLSAEEYNCWGAKLCDYETQDGLLILGSEVVYCRNHVDSVIIPSGVTSIWDYAFQGCSCLTSVTIPNSVMSIGDGAFQSCSALTSVTIPNSVTSIGSYAFFYCYLVAENFVNNSSLSAEKNNYWGAKLCDYETQEGLLILGSEVVYCRKHADSVVIPNRVKSIGEMAFSECTSLTSVTIPNTVESIGDMAFSDCHGLVDVYCYAEKVPDTGIDVFEGSTFFYELVKENATLHVPAASMSAYLSTSPWNGFGKIVALTEEETGIDELKSENRKVKTAVYDLSGRRVQKGEKGIFIQNGKVVLVR